MFSEGHQNGPMTECKIVGAAGSNKLGSAVAATGQDGRGQANAGGGLQLIH
jgi:hypothetical protein